MEASLTCAVCLSLLEEPVTLPLCAHNFCRACVAECLSQGRSAARPAGRPQEAPPPFCCPLCRKLCPLPDGGAATLPLNTALAEVVKLLRAGRQPGAGDGAEAKAEAAAAPSQLAALGGGCPKHPGRALQLYCRLCRRGACGQCVSEEHCSVFHAVNLVDTVYQEEKLTFFSSLKKIRTVYDKLMKEISSCPDEEMGMQNAEEVIKSEFGNISNAWEMRKKQLLDDLESQKKNKAKEYEIWKQMKETHRKTIENFLQDCEKLIDECDPQRFLEMDRGIQRGSTQEAMLELLFGQCANYRVTHKVACDLNLRMKTQLDLMQIASSYEVAPERKHMQMDTTSIVNEILALHLTEVNLAAFRDLPFGDSEHFVFMNNEIQWRDQKNKQAAFCPLAEVEIGANGKKINTRFMSISATAGFGCISHEEFRYSYYTTYRMNSEELKIQTSFLNGGNTLPISHSSNVTTLDAAFFPLVAKANNQKKIKTQILHRKGPTETSVSSSSGYKFKTRAANMTLSVSNNLFNVKGSPQNSKKTSLSENASSLLKTPRVPHPHAGAPPFGPQMSFTISPSSSELTPSTATILNPHASAAVVENPAPPLVSSSFDNLTSPIANGPSLSFQPYPFLGKFESHDYNKKLNINGENSSTLIAAPSTTTTDLKPGTEERRKPLFSTFSTHSGGFQTSKRNISQQTSFSFYHSKESQIGCLSTENNPGHSWSTSPAIDFGNQSVDNSNFAANVASETSGCSGKAATSPKQLKNSKVFSNSYSCEIRTPSVFSFQGIGKSNSDNLNPPTFFSKTSLFNEKPKDKKKAAEEISETSGNTPISKAKNLKFGSFSSIGKCPKMITKQFFPQQNIACDTASCSTWIPVNSYTENNSLLETSTRNEKTDEEDHIGCLSFTAGVNTDSDMEAASQSSSSSVSSSTSEYFSVAEDKTLPS